MNDDDLKYQLEEWGVSSDGMGLAITLCLKYGTEFVGNYIESTPYHARENPEKFQDQIIVNNITRLLVLEKELEQKFLFKCDNWSEVETIFCEIFDFHKAADWVFDLEDLIQKLEKRDFIIIYKLDDKKDKDYIFALGYKGKYEFEKFMREGYKKYLKDQDWWKSIRNN